ncbi:MAG TPA: Mur ligase domain-containing protein [Pontiella sp.]
MRRVHFIGIGGVGMNGLAQLAAQSGFSVTGSDRAYDPEAELFGKLHSQNIRIVPQDGSGIDRDTDTVVYSTAIEQDNPDLVKAESLAIPLLHRAEFLKELIGNDELIAVAGTAGKTTTAGLLGWILECLGKDPSVYNGAAVLNWKTAAHSGNIRTGRSGLWVIEADESDKSLLNFHPTHSIITNISRDHFELDELHALFNRFEDQTTGITIRGPVDCAATDLPMIGKHNLENARCAMALCAALGLDMNQVRDAVRRFKGIERRLEIAGETEGIVFIDDYAHNPVKIAAALDAVREKYGTVHAYWRPHGFSPLFQWHEELIHVFRKARPASLFILPVYYAGGTAQKKITAAEFAGMLESAGVRAELVPDYETLKNRLQECARSGHAILGMGARDPELPLFAKRMVAEWKTR